MQSLFEAVRKACLPAIWSQGVKLSRQNAVTRATASDSEITLRVRAIGHAVAPTVTLYPKDDEWSCDCGGHADPCAHVAAAAIACIQGSVAEATEQGVKSENPPLIVYRLDAKNKKLAVERFVVNPDGREERIQALTSDIARGRLPSSLAPTHADLAIDRLLATTRRDSIPFDRVKDLCAALANVDSVTFSGKPIRVSGDPLLPLAVLDDADSGGFELRLERDPSIEEVVAFGVARAASVLRPLGELATTGPLLERLPLSRIYSRGEQSELVTRVLPELEKKLPVDVRTRRLPRVSKSIFPRIHLDLSHHGHTLSVLPTLVYGEPPILRIDGDEAVALGDGAPLRRREQERELLARLRDRLNLVPGRRVDFDGTEAIRFAAKLREFDQQSGGGRSRALSERRELTARLIADDDSFDVAFETDGESEAPVARADTASVIRAWQDGLDLVPLDDGTWAPLPATWLAEHGHRVADLLAARDAERRVPRALLPDLGALCRELEVPPPPGLAELEPLLKDFTGIPKAGLPAHLNATLRPYQEQGVSWLAFLQKAELGAVLADDMGLGKTLQTLCVLRGRTLVVCPKSVVHNWAAEIARFRPDLTTTVYHGSRRELESGAAVTLTTYAVLRLDIERLALETWDAVVLDEAQAIKNADSQTARAAFRLKARFRVALSGTPVENRLEELWSLMHFANPGLLGTPADFRERTVAPVAAGEAEAASRLRARIRPFVLRRLKRDVLPELPPRTDSVLHVELDDVERSIYDAVRAATKQDIAEKLAHGGGVMAALEALLRLRQAACHAALVPGQVREGSSKVERLLGALEEAVADGHKALVFSQWTSLLNLIEPELRAAAIPFTRLDGSTRDRAGVVGEFQSENGPPVMLVSLKAGGTGLNLTAADHVFLLDPWWNPAVEDQAADRAHRIGQDRKVMVYRLVAKDTVEERILALQERKRTLSDVALGEAGSAAAITREELLALLD